MALVLVSGAIANKHGMGGETWVRLSWVLALRRLGFDVFFIEQIAPRTCVDGAGNRTTFEASANLAYFDAVVEAFDLHGAAALVCEEGPRAHGATWEELIARAEEAALLLNISGHLNLGPLMARLSRKAYIDIDPGFTQIWHAQGSPAARLTGHDFYFTIAENIGRPECSIPAGGIEWRTTRQPVVLEQWPVTDSGSPELFTTVASWRGGYGRLTHAGTTYGLKLHEFRKIMSLPCRTSQTFELALDIHPAEKPDLERLRENGWRLADPRAVVPDAESFRRYVQRSGSECSVAQGVYVEMGSGWFSDRTVRYLASGKPALVQETGFSRNLPSGEGLVPFRDLDEAVAGAESIAADYARHSKAARQLAEEYFDSDLVLGRLLEATEISP